MFGDGIKDDKYWEELLLYLKVGVCAVLGVRGISLPLGGGMGIPTQDVSNTSSSSGLMEILGMGLELA